MKKIKSKKAIFALGAIAAGLALLVTTSVGAQVFKVSLWDKIANVAGSVLGKTLADKVEDIALTDTNESQFGAQPGPDVFFPKETHNGVGLEYRAKTIAGTSTICSLEPPSATSTLEYWFGQITTNNMGAAQGPGGSTTHTWDLATSTNTYGTSSTSYMVGTVTAGEPATKGNFVTGLISGAEPVSYYFNGFVASTTLANGKGTIASQSVYVDDPQVFLGPNDRLNWKIATSTPGAFQNELLGSCGAIYRNIDVF